MSSVHNSINRTRSIKCISIIFSQVNEHVKNHNKMVKTRASQHGNGTNSFKAQSLQHGYGISVYRSRSMQRGHGLGRLFEGIFQVAVPILRRTVLKAGKKAMKTLGKRALKAGYGAIKDVAHDRENLRDALQKRFGNCRQSTIDKT